MCQDSLNLKLQKDWIKKVVMRMVPLKMSGTIDPGLTTVARYLVHDSSKYVSGNIFIVDIDNVIILCRSNHLKLYHKTLHGLMCFRIHKEILNKINKH